MSNKVKVSWREIDNACNKLAINILKDGFKPDYIVGITRGGLTPAVILSQILEVPMYTLKVTLRDGLEEDCDHNCWMPEDALGYNKEPVNILIVDDINDSGDTIAWIKQDWPGSCLPNSEKWNTCWNNNVKFAVVINNLASNENIDYSAMEINKAENDIWIDFPWERS
jgi:hypoxanthine phosphoribosyltransferase